MLRFVIAQTLPLTHHPSSPPPPPSLTTPNSYRNPTFIEVAGFSELEGPNRSRWSLIPHRLHHSSTLGSNVATIDRNRSQ